MKRGTRGIYANLSGTATAAEAAAPFTTAFIRSSTDFNLSSLKEKKS